MDSAASAWQPGIYDAELHRLHAMLEEMARSPPGDRGLGFWPNADGPRRDAAYCNAVHCWDSLNALGTFSIQPAHRQAQREYARRYAGDHVVESQVSRSYGDGAFAHITPNARTA